MSKIYQVVGLYDASCGEDSIMDASPIVKSFATREEADEACSVINDFYFERCKIHCAFEVREVDLDTLDTLDSLKADLNREYAEGWDPTC